MNNKKLLSLTLFIISIFLLNSSTVSVLAHEYDWEEDDDADDLYVDITINNAFYCDADFDGAEDDVVVEFTLKIEIRDWRELYFYRLKVELTLPSGFEYKHIFYLRDRPSDHSVLFMYNHATEPGWYTVKMDCSAYADDDRAHDKDSLIFDPPEGIGGTEPPIAKLYL